MFDKILVVCVGNICRSPTGEQLLRKLLPTKQIASAGLGVKPSGLGGKPADPMAIEVAAEHGVNLCGHHAQQLTTELCEQYDLVLVMEKKHIEGVTHIAPQARGKTMLFAHWIEQRDIPDPHRQSREAFEFAYELLEASALAWVNKL